MNQIERKTIFRCYSGSHLHGTNHRDSDTDYMGIFLPSFQDAFSLDPELKELKVMTKADESAKNTKEDIDEVLFHLKTFLKLASEGQSNQLEMLFAHEEAILNRSRIYDEIRDSRHLFITKVIEKPFFGFVKSQFKKSTSKAKNLGLIQEVLTELAKIESAQKNKVFNTADKT